MSRLSGKRLFTVLDLRNGLWQMELDSESAVLTAFMNDIGGNAFHLVQIFVDISGIDIYFDDMFV